MSFTGDDDENGTVPDEFADTQEEEFESEEQWRKQRHEREVFLRTMVSIINIRRDLIDELQFTVVILDTSAMAANAASQKQLFDA